LGSHPQRVQAIGPEPQLNTLRQYSFNCNASMHERIGWAPADRPLEKLARIASQRAK
jgi:hypothetical protein